MRAVPKHSSIGLGIHSFITLCALQQVHSLFQSEFSTECDLTLSLSVSTILSFP